MSDRPAPRYFWIRDRRDVRPTVGKVSYGKDGREAYMEFFGCLMDADARFAPDGLLEGFEIEGEMVVRLEDIIGEIEEPQHG